MKCFKAMCGHYVPETGPAKTITLGIYHGNAVLDIGSVCEECFEDLQHAMVVASTVTDACNPGTDWWIDTLRLEAAWSGKRTGASAHNLQLRRKLLDAIATTKAESDRKNRANIGYIAQLQTEHPEVELVWWVPTEADSDYGTHVEGYISDVTYEPTYYDSGDRLFLDAEDLAESLAYEDDKTEAESSEEAETIMAEQSKEVILVTMRGN